MFSFQEYIIGWAVYLITVIGLLFCTWYITRGIPWLYVKQVLRLIAATLFLTPIAIDNTTAFYAPAWIKAGLQLVFEGVDGFMPVGHLLLMVLLGVLLVYVLLLIGLQLYRRHKNAESPQQPKQRPSQ